MSTELPPLADPAADEAALRVPGLSTSKAAALHKAPRPNRMRGMQWPRPRSLTGLMLIGLAIIAVPLLWAIITAALQMRTLTTTGQNLVVDGATGARDSETLASQLLRLEGTVKSYEEVLHSPLKSEAPKWLASYRKLDADLDTARAKLAAHSSASVRQTLEDLGTAQRAVEQLVATTASNPEAPYVEELENQFKQIASQVDRMYAQINEEIDGALKALQMQADNARARLIYESVALLPLTALAIIGLTMVIGRPLRKLDTAIRDLGENKNLSKPIEVPGPLDLERLGTRLEWLRLRMLELDNERSRFMRHMSHELKTPLAAIADGTELLMDGTVGTLDPAQQEVMEILREKSKSLQEMIDNLLSFTAWQTSRVGLVPGEFGLRSLVKQVIENHRIIILRQRIRLDLRIDEITLFADRSKFRLIVENLVSNALKYSPKGGTIHIKARTDGSQLVLDIADHGPGIAVDEREHIFDAFFTGRAAKARKSSLKGTGIGLSVVLEFVSAHQGRIEIIDGEYPGAHFRISMPLHLEGGDVPGNEKARAHAA